MPEGFLCPQAILPIHAAMDGHDSAVAPRECGDLLAQIVQRIAMFGEDDELLVSRRLVSELRATFRPNNTRIGRVEREDFTKQPRQFLPFFILAAAPEIISATLKAL